MPPLLLLSLVLAADPRPADTWPGFRGDGTSRTTARNLPVAWAPKEGVAWRVGLPGYGQSSPVIWKDHVFVTAVSGADKQTCIVAAADLKTGKMLWTKEFTATQKGKNNPSMSRAASTPVADADGVYVFFESGELVGLGHDGKVLWERSLTKEYGQFKNHHGLAGSLAQTEKAVVVLVDHSGPSYLLAVDKATGKNLWKSDRTSRLSWTTPVIATHAGKTFVLVSSNGSLTCYDAETGKEQWSYGELSGNLIPSPVVVDDLVLVGAGESGLTTDMKAGARSNCCLRLTNKDGKPGRELLWQGKKAVLHHASPVVHRGRAYLLTKAGILHCLDAATGEEVYAERLDNSCWATPVAAGDHIYFFGKDGKTTVIEAGPKFNPVAVNRLWSDADSKGRLEAAEKAPENQFPPLPEKGRAEMETMLKDAVGDVVYGVGVVDGTFVARTGTELFCIRAMVVP